MPTREEIEAARSSKGGWTKETLAKWGVPWPPPKGWRARLEGREQKRDHVIIVQYAGRCTHCSRSIDPGEEAVWNPGEGLLCAGACLPLPQEECG